MLVGVRRNEDTPESRKDIADERAQRTLALQFGVFDDDPANCTYSFLLFIPLGRTAESLLKRPGIIETAAGYTGAPDNAKRPNYDSVCFGKDWVEGVRVVYDDEEVTYEELLDEFMVSQKPGYQRQYASVIFVDDKDEEKAARQWIKRADPAVLERRKDGLTYDVVESECPR